MLYLLAALLLLNITNFDYVHKRRLNKLKSENYSLAGNNANVAINVWNYRRRLEPGNITVLKSLGKYYLLASDSIDAKETLNGLLCIDPPHDKDRPEFLRAYSLLAGSDKIHCKDKVIYDLLFKYFI